MARKTAVYVVDREGSRDHGKVFHLREMSAYRGEEWASKLLIALASGNVQVPEGFFNMGWQAIAVLGIRGLGSLPWQTAKELLAEMFAHITIAPDPSRPNFTRPLIDNGGDGDDIEEIATRLLLREAWIDLHLGFSLRAQMSISTEGSATSTNPPGQNIATFPAPLAR
jgi:hypothetical protein